MTALALLVHDEGGMNAIETIRLVWIFHRTALESTPSSLVAEQIAAVPHKKKN
jgi:hypothetical protein